MRKKYNILAFAALLGIPPSISAQKPMRDINDGKTDNQSVSITAARATRMSESYAELEELYLKGIGLLQLGKLEGAAKAFEEVAKKDEKNDAAAYQLAKIYEAQKQMPAAFAQAQRAVAIAPENRWYKIFLMQLYARNGEYKNAAQIGEQIAAKDKNFFDDEMQQELAESLEKSGQFDKALKIYDKFEQLYGLQEEIAKKKYAIFVVKKEINKAVAILQRYVKTEPSNLDAQHLLAETLLMQGKNGEAEQVYDQILTIKPDDVRANLVRSASKKAAIKNNNSNQDIAFLDSKMAFFEEKNTQIDQKIRELLPFLQKLNEQKVKENNTPLLEKLLEIGVKLENMYPNDGKILALQGDLFYQHQQPVEALARYEKCTRLVKNIYSVFEQKMRIEEEMGDFTALFATSNEAVERFPNQAAAFFFNGLASARLNKNTDATDALQQALLMSARKPPLKADILAELGWLKAKNKDFNAAEKAFGEANALAPNTPSILLKQTNAMLLGNENMKTDALKLVDNLAEISHNAIVSEAIGDTYARANQLEKATQWWQKAKTMGGQSKNLDKKIATQKMIE
ncbi:MAG: hypothetical protein RL757_466 [Bacteroidota bacterium]|jgi:tetratricopeptide (TPR) repeat protein